MNIIWGLLAGIWLGINDRHNDEMVAAGIRPPWSNRHPFVSAVLWFLATSVVFFGGVILLVYAARLSPWLALGLVVGGIGWACFAAYRRADRRWDPDRVHHVYTSQPQIVAGPKTRQQEIREWAIAIPAALALVLVLHLLF